MSHDRAQRLAREWDFVQRERVGLGNMQKALARMGLPDRTDVAGRVDHLEKVEAAIMNELRLQMRSDKEGAEPWLRSVHAYVKGTLGLGDASFCVVGLIPPLPAFANPAKLWRYCGLDPVDGKARKAKAGEKLGFSKRLRSYCIMRLVDPVIKCRESKYRAVYDARRAHTDVTHPEWSIENPKAPDMHSHRDAMRVTAKKILLDLWRAARDLHAPETQREIVSPAPPDLQMHGLRTTDTLKEYAPPDSLTGCDQSAFDAHGLDVAPQPSPRRRAARDRMAFDTLARIVSPAADTSEVIHAHA